MRSVKDAIAYGLRNAQYKDVLFVYVEAFTKT